MHNLIFGKYSGFVYGSFSIIGMVLIYILLTRILQNYSKKHCDKHDALQTCVRYWQYIYAFMAAVVCITAFSGEMEALGLSMAFMGSILGWMLSAPIRNMAGWLFLIISKPLKVTDRIIIGGYTGDVVDVNMNFIVLDQVGGTTVGEERSGRGIHVPTSFLFGYTIQNYSMKLPSDTAGKKHLLDEVLVRITYNSDWDEAERILIESAREVTANIVSETGEEPYIRAEFFPSGVFMRIRYNVAPTDRQRVWSEIVKKITTRIEKSDKVFYCINRANVIVNPRHTDGQLPPQSPLWTMSKGEVKKHG
jgi:small-conductance mechanosensitive channel